MPTVEELKRVRVLDNGERLVDLRAECPGLSFEIADYLNSDGTRPEEVKDAHFVRYTVAGMIASAQDSLPPNLSLLVRCGYRTPEVQARQYKKDYADLATEYPDWPKSKLDIEIEKRTSSVEVAPHCTGGAVDISIVDETESQLDMGTKMGTFGEKTYTYSDKISERVKANRAILLGVMEKAGFVNFPGEWWHFSYGDLDWAYATNQVSVYGPIERVGESYVQRHLVTNAIGAQSEA